MTVRFLLSWSGFAFNLVTLRRSRSCCHVSIISGWSISAVLFLVESMGRCDFGEGVLVLVLVIFVALDRCCLAVWGNNMSLVLWCGCFLPE